MKKINYFFFGVLLTISSVTLSQSTKHSWYIGIGTHAVDHTSVDPIGDIFYTKDYSFSYPVSKFTISNSLNNNFSIDLQTSIGKIDNKRLNIQNELFILTGLGLKYNFTNGRLLSRESRFDPYIRIGGNYHRYNYTSFVIKKGESEIVAFDKGHTEPYVLDKTFVGRKNHIIANAGIGFNIWLIKNLLGINLESMYNYNILYKTRYTDFLNHSFSLVYQFGNKKSHKISKKIINNEKFNKISNTETKLLNKEFDNKNLEKTIDLKKNEIDNPLTETKTESQNSACKKNHKIETNYCAFNVEQEEDNISDDIDSSSIVEFYDNIVICKCFKNDDLKKNINKKNQISKIIVKFNTNKSSILNKEIINYNNALKKIKYSGKIYFIKEYPDYFNSLLKDKVLSKKRAKSAVNISQKKMNSQKLTPKELNSKFSTSESCSFERKKNNKRN